MKVKYIYNSEGKIESAVIPFKIWNKIKFYVYESENELNKHDKKEFNPSEYKGLLSHYHFDIEHEIENIKNHRKRDI